jgi:hypothetical protein
MKSDDQLYVLLGNATAFIEALAKYCDNHKLVEAAMDFTLSVRGACGALKPDKLQKLTEHR